MVALQNVDERLGVLVAPRCVEADGADLLLPPVHAVDGERAVRGVGRGGIGRGVARRPHRQRRRQQHGGLPPPENDLQNDPSFSNCPPAGPFPAGDRRVYEPERSVLRDEGEKNRAGGDKEEISVKI